MTLDMIGIICNFEIGMSIPITERLKEATRALHTEVERAGVMRLLLRGQLERIEYCRLLRNFHAIYAALETGLSRHAGVSGIAALDCVPLFRSNALHDDLTFLHGADWAVAIPITGAATQYVEHLQGISEHAPLMLGAHAYVRYLGDLSGGQMLARIVAKTLDLPPGEGVKFYEFGSVDDVKNLAHAFRLGLDLMADHEASAQALIDEGCAAFARHRELFEALGRDNEATIQPVRR